MKHELKKLEKILEPGLIPKIDPDSPEGRVAAELGLFKVDYSGAEGFKSKTYWRKQIAPDDYHVMEGKTEQRYSACVTRSP